MVDFVEEWGPGYHRYTYGTPPANAALDARDAVIAELRRVLEPLLDDPWRLAIDRDDGLPMDCLFCLEPAHAPDCPVPRRDELLGRASS
jgi:hypothetical protein